MKWLLIVSSVCYLASYRRLFFAAGVAGGCIYALIRGFSIGRLPLIGPHDTIVFFSLSIGLMAFVTSCSSTMKDERWFSVVSGMTAAFFTLFSLMFQPLNMPLPQILDTLWFELHVVLAFFGYALFVVGGILGAAFLTYKNRRLLDVQYKSALAGWSFFSASMLSGGIWGYYAWGTYWLWTPKELWTSVLWLYYALLLHVRFKKGTIWENSAAWLGIIGVFVMLFTYLGVSMLMKSSHSF